LYIVYIYLDPEYNRLRPDMESHMPRDLGRTFTLVADTTPPRYGTTNHRRYSIYTRRPRRIVFFFKLSNNSS